MKLSKLFCAAGLAAMLSLTACNTDSVVKDAARESLASTNATTSSVATTPSIPNATPSTPALPVGPLTSIAFAKSKFDFGEIMEGEKVEHEFTFTNTGDEPLILTNAKSTCGCTVPDWPREPIAPGDSGVIMVRYDSRGKGAVDGRKESKKVTITANTNPTNTFIDVTGMVYKDAAAAQPAS